MNLTAFKLSGFILFPYVCLRLRTLIKVPPIFLLLVYLLYLLLLGVYFGHINPWVDETGFKTGRDVAQWRSILHIGSMILEYTSTIYLALNFQNLGILKRSLKVLIWGSFASLAGGFIELITNFDLYNLFTGAKTESITDRMKGLNYEPRGFGQTLAYGSILSLGYVIQGNKKYILLFLLLIIGQFYLTITTTGLLVLVFGLAIYFLLYVIFKKISFKKILLPVLLLFVVATTSIYFKKQIFVKHINDRSYLISDLKLIEKFEVLDAAALNFLYQNPKHLIFGTGPGLITIPIGTKYLVREDVYQWPEGLVALPHMGLILQVSNGGLVGVFLWLLPIFVMIRHICLRDLKPKDEESLAIVYSITLILIYLIQIRYLYYIGFAILLGSYIRSSKFTVSKSS